MRGPPAPERGRIPPSRGDPPAGIVRHVERRSGRDGSFRANFYGKRVKMGVLTVNFRTRTAGGP